MTRAVLDKYCAAALVVIVSVGLHVDAAADPIDNLKTDKDWASLSDDSSRSDLFQKIIAADEAERSRNPNPLGQPFNLSGPFTFPQNARFDDGKPRQNSIFGIDISHYSSSNLDFSVLKQQNIRYVYAKATQGVGYKDGKFATFWSALAALPPGKQVLRGAYHFLSSTGDGTAQAKSFLKYVNLHGGIGAHDMPPVVDLEWDIAHANGPDRWAGQTPKQIEDTALAWLNYVEQQTHRVPVLYTARSWWRERNIPESDFAKFAHYKVWIADYSSSHRAVEIPAVPANNHWHIWQFSAAAKLSAGYGGGMDANIYKGTEQQFLTDFDVPRLP
jgi:lysozyme